MDKRGDSSRWYLPWRTQAAPSVDPADQGTAFGLDMSLQAERNAAGRAEVVTPPARPGWIRRLGLRRRAAA